MQFGTSSHNQNSIQHKSWKSLGKDNNAEEEAKDFSQQAFHLSGHLFISSPMGKTLYFKRTAKTTSSSLIELIKQELLCLCSSLFDNMFCLPPKVKQKINQLLH